MTSPSRSAASLTGHFKPGDRVFVAGLTGESQAVLDELRQHPQRVAGVEFTSVQLPSIDQADYLSFHPESRLRAFFMTPAMRRGLLQRRASLHPLDYTAIAGYLRDAQPFDSVIAQFSPPDADGWCLPGLTADFTPLVWRQAARRVAHLNPRLPRIGSGFRVHVSEFDAVVEADAPLLSVDEPPSTETGRQIGRNAAALIRDGDTLQFGIGAVMSEVASALHGHRNLRIHSGMIAAFVGSMWESGCLDPDADVVTGVIFGNAPFYEYAASCGRIRLEDVRHTHAIGVLAGIRRLVGVNSAVEVDLLGQVNSERGNGMLQAGPGGLPAFAQASVLAPDGRLLICLPSSARNGSLSRIVPSLGAGGLCTVPRYLADAVVTEYGVAEIRGLPMDERAQALLAIAHPDHQQSLAEAWEQMRAQI